MSDFILYCIVVLVNEGFLWHYYYKLELDYQWL